jgi:hypothetical protein
MFDPGATDSFKENRFGARRPIRDSVSPPLDGGRRKSGIAAFDPPCTLERVGS